MLQTVLFIYISVIVIEVQFNYETYTCLISKIAVRAFKTIAIVL